MKLIKRNSSAMAQYPTSLAAATADVPSLAAAGSGNSLLLKRRMPSRLFSILASIIRAACDFFGTENEYVIGDPCLYCSGVGLPIADVVHGPDEKCTRKMEPRWCADCRRVRELDRYGNCAVCGSHAIDYRSRPIKRPINRHHFAVVSSATAASTQGMVMKT